ncbi:hypothetical protein FIC_02022 [Flavobacteriaceae bacterium 3519-10]|nr:hypothetical protein FIC_02022 [Flavobacteriaceae bacterium 3519-10]
MDKLIAMKNLLLLILLLSSLCTAQTHRFIYGFQFKSDSLAKEFRTENMVLDVNPDNVKFYPYMYAENDSLNKVRDFKNIIWDDSVPALSRKRDSNENVSFLLTSDFFSIKTVDPISWKLTEETKKSADYTLQKATTQFGGRNWTAWFSKEVPISEGPYKFRGLPGLIFELYDDKDNFKFALIKSQQFKDTYDTSLFLESFAGKKPIAITEKVWLAKQLENYNDPLREMKQAYKNNTDPSARFMYAGKQVTGLDQFKPLTEDAQARIRRENNPIEISKAIRFPQPR